MPKLKPVNRVIKFLVAGSAFLYTGWGFIIPIFAIFIVQNIDISGPAEAAEVAGFAFFIYWVMKSLFQIPISAFFDKRHGEKDDYWFMVLGLFITGLTPFGFLFSSQPWHIYGLEVLHALGMALYVPSWNAIFTRHMDKGREAFEWALDSTFLGLGAGITGAIGGVIAALFGFTFVFIFAGITNIIGSFVLLLVHKDILPKDHISPWFFPRKPNI